MLAGDPNLLPSYHINILFGTHGQVSLIILTELGLIRDVGKLGNKVKDYQEPGRQELRVFTNRKVCEARVVQSQPGN